MRGAEIDAWALRVADAVKAGQHVEDSRVELKREWPADAAKVARRIAGLANAARGDDVLWIIGLDEESGVKGAEVADTASWWASVGAFFDEQAPRLTDRVVYVDGAALVAMHFSAEGAPFTVRNPAFGTSTGGPVEREVPWRDGTATRSARRSDLVRLLVPRTATPRLEVLKASVSGRVSSGPNRELEWGAEVSVYVECALGESVVIPWHRTSALFRVPACGLEADLGSVAITGHSVSSNDGRTLWGPRVNVATIHTGSEQVLIEGPGRMRIAGGLDQLPVVAAMDVLAGEAAILHVEWLAVDAEQPQALTIDLPWTEPTSRDPQAEWRGLWSIE